MLDVQSIRKDFPILDHKIYDKPLIYFDNGATTQKPRPVVEKIESGYYNVNANIHRGVHFLRGGFGFFDSFFGGIGEGVMQGERVIAYFRLK